MAMTTSMTRSRRAEHLHFAPPKTATGHRLVNAKTTPNTHHQFALSPPHPKRQLEASARDFDPIIPKKARFTTGIAVEIPARASFHIRFSKEAPNGLNQSRAPPAAAPEATQARAQQHLTKHQEKLANGLKHELNKLQPNAADTKDQGRKLRSQEATRFKSELSAYFPEYDEVVGNDPKEHHLLNLDTPIIITSSDYARSSTTEGSNSPHHQSLQQPPARETYPIRSYSDPLFTDLFDSQRIDFSFLSSNKTAADKGAVSDPLPDGVFEPAHRKAERLERSIRNSEKGRAQHERDQIIRLLDSLQGHDWLRVMGVSGITESRKKAFEPARDHFVQGCQAILDKFRRWAAEEKRRKQRKERAAAAERLAAAAGAGKDGEDEGGEEDEEEEQERSGDDGEERGVADSDAAMDHDEDEVEGEPPDDSDDVDASIAKQLREEALAAAAAKKKRLASRRGRGRGGPPPRPKRPSLEAESEPPKEFTSFFAKRYQREAALSKNRRRGRKVLAWGQPIPDFAEADFELPAELRNEDALKSHARRKRRDKRGRH